MRLDSTSSLKSIHAKRASYKHICKRSGLVWGQSGPSARYSLCTSCCNPFAGASKSNRNMFVLIFNNGKHRFQLCDVKCCLENALNICFSNWLLMFTFDQLVLIKTKQNNLQNQKKMSSNVAFRWRLLIVTNIAEISPIDYFQTIPPPLENRKTTLPIGSYVLVSLSFPPSFFVLFESDPIVNMLIWTCRFLLL